MSFSDRVIKMKPTTIGNLCERYDEAPVVKALASLIPGWGVASELMSYRAKQMRDDRLRHMLDALAAGEEQLSPELIESDDFLYSFFAASSAAVRSRRQEKCRVIGALLRDHGAARSPNGHSKFDFYLRIVDELNPTDAIVLRGIAKFKEAADEQNPLEKGSPATDLPNWHTEFFSSLENETGLTVPELTATIHHLESLGLYERLHWIDTEKKLTSTDMGMGNFTLLYAKLKDVLADLSLE